jgi:hypothetical protein
VQGQGVPDHAPVPVLPGGAVVKAETLEQAVVALRLALKRGGLKFTDEVCDYDEGLWEVTLLVREAVYEGIDVEVQEQDGRIFFKVIACYVGDESYQYLNVRRYSAPYSAVRWVKSLLRVKENPLRKVWLREDMPGLVQDVKKALRLMRAGAVDQASVKLKDVVDGLNECTDDLGRLKRDNAGRKS